MTNNDVERLIIILINRSRVRVCSQF